MAKKSSRHESATPATEWLKAHRVPFDEFVYDYVEHGGTTHVANTFGFDHHRIVKTLIMQDEHAKPLVVLMHGDCEVSTKNLARQIGRKHIAPCAVDQAQRHSGYQVGGTSPFGTRKLMPVFVERSILDLPGIYINGGRRGYIVAIDPSVLTSELHATPVNVALPGS